MTFEEMMDRAYGHSTKNQPSELATEDPELLEVAFRIYQALYTIGSIVAPSFYGAETTEADNGSGGWDQPADADTIFYLEDNSGDEVAVVPFDEKDAENGARVYPMGQAFYPVDPSGVGPDPANPLTIYHTIPPSAPTQITDTTPAEYPDNHEDLPILQLALYLTGKDLGGRQQEYQVLSNQRDRELARYVGMLENRLPTMRSRFSSPKRVQDRSLVSMRDILTGSIGGAGGG